MSLTYVDQPYADQPAGRAEDRPVGFTPAYARTRTRRKGMRSWMILAPVGAVTLGAIAVFALTAPSDEAAMAPAVPEAAPSMAAPLTGEPVILPLAPEAPALEAAPAAMETAVETGAIETGAVEAAPPAAAPVERRAASMTASATAPAAVEPEVVIPAGPQSYEALVAEEGASAAPAAEAAPAETPLVVVQPD